MKSIFLTPEQKNEIRADLEKKIAELREKAEAQLSAAGSCKVNLDFDKSFKYDKAKKEKATLYYTPSAYMKMRLLVDNFSSEVAWHGFIKRISANKFLVYDIVVYEQFVTGVHVDTDEEAYNKFVADLWMNHEEPDFCFNFQGHSHVRMAVSPSGTDLEDQKRLMSNQKKGFYVFTIQNKNHEANYWIYDYDNNIVYEKDDIVVDIKFGDYDGADFLSAAQEKVKQQTLFYPPVKKTEPVTAQNGREWWEGYFKNRYAVYGQENYPYGYNDDYYYR